MSLACLASLMKTALTSTVSWHVLHIDIFILVFVIASYCIIRVHTYGVSLVT